MRKFLIFLGIMLGAFVIFVIWGIAMQTGTPSGEETAKVGQALKPGQWLPIFLLAVVAGAIVGIFTLPRWWKIPAAVVGVMAFATWSHSGGQLPWPTSSNSEKSVVASTSPNCNGEVFVVDLGPSPVVVSPGGRCIVKWRVDSGRVELIDRHGNTLEVGPEGGNFPAFWTEKARAADGFGSASMHYKLVSG